MQTNFHDYVCAFFYLAFLSKMWYKNVVYFSFKKSSSNLPSVYLSKEADVVRM